MAFSRSWRHGLSVALAALVVTLLNCCKPLHIDDSAYYRYAAQIAGAPLSPYDFEIVWCNEARPANEVMAPPVLPYWWAGALRLFGDRAVVWKLWLLPFHLVLAFALFDLFRRFAHRFAGMLTWMTLLSPALLPGVNLMLDVPALALSLMGIALFARAVDQDRPGLAALAGLVLGLAMQTKYTALVTPLVAAAYGGLFERKRLALLTVALAGVLFVAWECWIASRHGQSHFLCSLSQQPADLPRKAAWLLMPLLTLLGCLAPATGLLGLAALGMSGRLLAALAGVTAALSALAFGLPVPVWSAWCAGWGVLLSGVTVAVLVRLLRGSAVTAERIQCWRSCRVEVFLLTWLALEIAGYLVLSPFPAARRILPLSVVLMSVCGRLLGRTCRTAAGRVAAGRLAYGSMLLGLGFFLVDWREAAAARELVECRATAIPAGQRGWFIGDWGLAFYGPRHGLAPVVLNRSRLRRGDWLLVPDAPWQVIALDLHALPLETVQRLVIDDAFAARTVVGYYGGRLPLESRDGPRLGATLYRVTADCTPAKAPTSARRASDGRDRSVARAPG